MVREFRKELAHIRDRINFLFDRLELAETEAKKASVSQLQMAPKPVQPAPVVEKGKGWTGPLCDISQGPLCESRRQALTLYIYMMILPAIPKENL